MITPWARRLVIVILAFAALAWGVRQLSLTYQVWKPQKIEAVSKTVPPSIPDGAKTIGENFLIFWFSTKMSPENKKIMMKDFLTDRVSTQLDSNPDFVSQNSNTKIFRVDTWDSKWVEVGKKAYIQYLVKFQDNRTFLVQLPLVKEGTWLIDSLPSLLPLPVPNTSGTVQSPTLSSTDTEKIYQAVDGFFDSWLSGRQDQNTKLQNIAPTNLLNAVQGTYKDVVVTPLETNPSIIVSAVVQIETKGGLLLFEYQLQIGKQTDQYFVQNILGGGQ